MDNEQLYPETDFADLEQPAAEETCTASSMEEEVPVLAEDTNQAPCADDAEQGPYTASPFADSPYETAWTQVPAKPKKEKKQRHIPVWGIVAAVLIAALAINTIAMSVQNASLREQMELLSQSMSNKISVLQQQIESADLGTVSGGTAVQEGAMTPGQVYAQNVRAVVAIASSSIETNIYGQVSETASAGSGFIISADGYVVTNYHVIEGATEVSVITYDAREYAAQIVGSDSTNDIALLKLEGEEFPYVTIGSSDALAVGDQVVAIGNPLGELTSTLTVGYVSAKDRVVTTDGTSINMLQTDAAINSGNSGGPLFNMQGQVVGITTAKYSGTSSSGATIEGIGFAIPMDDIAGMVEDLREYGYVTGTYLGVMVRDVSEAAQSYGLPAGAYVEEITSGYCAEAAGVKAQDIIINIGGYDVTSVTDLTRVLRSFEPGETTTITVYRSGKEVNLSITLDEKPQQLEEEETQQQVYPDSSQNPFENMFPDYWEYFFGG